MIIFWMWWAILLRMNKLNIIAFLAVLLLCSCLGERPEEEANSRLQLDWVALDSINGNLPEGVRVYHSRHTGANLRAWYVFVEESSPEIETRVVVSSDADGRETVSEFAGRLGAPVLINGGYFRMDLNPAKHVGLLKVNGELIHAATHSVLRGEQRFYLHRAALALDSNDVAEIGWVSSDSDSVFFWERPIKNFPGDPGIPLNDSFRTELSSRDMLGGGPQLIRDGEINLSVNEEVFFGTTIPDVHPRTAVGITAHGDLILLLVDGRQLVSRGVNLRELAEILYDLGCVDALNLDGGGSSALVVNGVLLNRPAGKTDEREVMSALAVFAK